MYWIRRGQILIGSSDGRLCISCESGKYTNTTGTTLCVDCETGSWAAAGSSSCTPCISNTTSPTGSTTCYCNVGFSGLTTDTCMGCGAGQFTDKTGSFMCDNCDAGSWSAGGTSSCTQCPSSSSSLMSSSASTSCQCNVGFSGQSGAHARGASLGSTKTQLEV